MKIWAISLLLLFFLTGCDSSSELERGMALRSSILKAQTCSMNTVITADYGERSCAFSLNCHFDSQGNMSFTVTQPETIAGIKGNVSADKGTVEFDDTVLFFDLMADGQLSPVSAPWVLMKALRGGYIRTAGIDGELLWLTVDDSYSDDALQVDIWLNEDNEPARAEIVYRNRRILSMKVESMEIM